MKKIYNSNGIVMAAFLGGPLAAGYFLSKNFQAFEKKDDSQLSLLLGTIITIGFLGSIYFIPEDVIEKIPNYLFPILFLVTAKLLVDKYQKSEIERYNIEGGEFYSNWRTAGISLLFSVGIFIAAIMVFMMIDLLMP